MFGYLNKNFMGYRNYLTIIIINFLIIIIIIKTTKYLESNNCYNYIIKLMGPIINCYYYYWK
jgi:hypothetical protein